MTAAPATIKFIGCSPSTGKVQAKFDPVNAKPGTSSFTVPAVQAAGDPGTFTLDLSQARAGTVYKVLALTDDQGCISSSSVQQAYWLGGGKLDISFVIAGKTKLWTNPYGTTTNIVDWRDEIYIVGYENAKNVPFRIETELKGAHSIQLQASYFSMPTDLSTDPMSPPGLLSTWDITQACTNCTFKVDISKLLPPQSSPQKNWAQSGLDSIITFFGGIGNGAENTVQLVSNMLQGEKNSNEVAKMTQVTLSPPTSTNLGKYVTSTGSVAPPTTFYFRVVLLDKDGKPAGNPSNSVKISWSAKESSGGPDFTFNTPPASTEKPYANWNVELISYHGLLRPKKGDACFIVTENTKGTWTANHYHAPGDPSHVDSPSFVHQYYKDDIICQPEPPEGCGWSDLAACISDIGNFFEDAINWVSKAYSSAKNTAVGFAADSIGVIPIPGCDKSCLKSGLSIGMDVALTSMGVPPSIPNFAELEDQGLDYLAEQAVANSQIPQGALDAAKVAGIDPKEEIKKGIKKGLAETQTSYAGSFNWLPEGVPVRPDGPQLPTVTLNLTRSKNDPSGDCNGGGIFIDAYAMMSGDFPGYKPYHPSYLPADIETLDLKAGGTYRVFEPKSVSLPCVAPGTSLIIPVVLNPYSPHVGLNPPDKGYFWWLYPYSKSGELRLQTHSGEVKFNFVPNDPKW